MAFKIKDLMINIAPSEANIAGCKERSGCTATGVCDAVSACRASTYPTPCDAVSACRASTRTICDWHSGCRATTRTICDANSECRASTYPSPEVPCTASTREPGGEGLLAELLAIKAELNAALATVDKRIAELEETMKPHTLAEIEELQTRLKEALEELDKRKEEFDKK
jgi:hypothetical protein